MFVIGIDPGLTRCGYAVLDQSGRTTRAVALGVISTPKENDTPNRLAQLQQELDSLFKEYPPQILAVEKVFFSINRKTAMAVNQAAGIALALGALVPGCEIFEYSPTEIKRTLTNWGGADKSDIQEMVKILLGLEEEPKQADAADAAAAALCHLAHAPAFRH